MPARVACFIDGFNLYHAIDDLRFNHLKWVNLWKLAETFTDPAHHELVSVYYFSAFATWLPDRERRHRAFVDAQRAFGVIPIMGRFKEKDRRCQACGATWKAHEEKETDVNLALWLLKEAFADTYDVALLVSADSDLAPAVRLVRGTFPAKKVKILAPPGRSHSAEMAAAVGIPNPCPPAVNRRKHLGWIKQTHLEGCLLPQQVVDPTGSVVAVRPAKWDPPAAS